MFSIALFPSNFATSTWEVSTMIISDLSPYLILVLGVILTVLVVSVIIKAIHR